MRRRYARAGESRRGAPQGEVHMMHRMSHKGCAAVAVLAIVVGVVF